MNIVHFETLKNNIKQNEKPTSTSIVGVWRRKVILSFKNGKHLKI